MKTIAKVLVLLGMGLLLTGCGRDVTRDIARGQRFALFEVRLLGQDPGSFSAALLSVSQVTATTRGLPLEVEPAMDTMDLTATNQAWLLGRVKVPEGVTDVDFSLRFDDAGGYESARGNGAVESRGATVSWRAPVSWLKTHGHTVVHMDLSRSLVATGADATRLVPSATIHY